MTDELRFKRFSHEGIKRRHYLGFRKEDLAKKYIHDFISSLEEEYIQATK